MKTKLFFILFVALINQAFADSTFDCSNATSNLEKMICADQSLANLNATNNDLYLKAKQLDSSSSSDINREWYFNLRKCNDDVECIRSAYQDVNNAYQDVIKRNTPVVETAQTPPPNDDSKNSANSDDDLTKKASSWIDSLSLGDWLAIIGLICFLIYFLPTIVAFSRGHRNRWIIFIINVVFGATFFGWIIALIWALNKIDDPVKGGVKHDSQPHDPVI